MYFLEYFCLQTSQPMGGNIGFVVSDALPKFKIIDFAITDTREYWHEDIYRGFLSGNSAQRFCDSVDAVVKYILLPNKTRG